MPQEKICPSCGNHLKSDMNFCTACGTRLPATPVAVQPAPPQSQAVFSTPQMNQVVSSYSSDDFTSEADETTILGAYDNYADDETTLLSAATPQYSGPVYQAVLVRSDNAEKIFVNVPNFILGRSPESTNYHVQGSTVVSRKHAQLQTDGAGNYYITDLGTKNKTYVNNTEIPLNTPIQVRSGDVMILADIEFKVLVFTEGASGWMLY
ncbi:MAG: FHA domain-containing protein [Clostridiales Family XIII bacterium]|jgi:hypothetical protein|nr:FHA domain-containing protein [Clostridiales Family XIII bacterium]